MGVSSLSSRGSNPLFEFAFRTTGSLLEFSLIVDLPVGFTLCKLLDVFFSSIPVAFSNPSSFNEIFCLSFPCSVIVFPFHPLPSPSRIPRSFTFASSSSSKARKSSADRDAIIGGLRGEPMVAVRAKSASIAPSLSFSSSCKFHTQYKLSRASRLPPTTTGNFSWSLSPHSPQVH